MTYLWCRQRTISPRLRRPKASTRALAVRSGQHDAHGCLLVRGRNPDRVLPGMVEEMTFTKPPGLTPEAIVLASTDPIPPQVHQLLHQVPVSPFIDPVRHRGSLLRSTRQATKCSFTSGRRGRCIGTSQGGSETRTHANLRNIIDFEDRVERVTLVRTGRRFCRIDRSRQNSTRPGYPLAVRL